MLSGVAAHRSCWGPQEAHTKREVTPKPRPAKAVWGVQVQTGGANCPRAKPEPGL